MTIKEYLEREGRKLNWLARETGIGLPQLSLYQNGKSEPKMVNAKRIYAATDGAVTEFGQWPEALAEKRADGVRAAS